MLPITTSSRTNVVNATPRLLQAVTGREQHQVITSSRCMCNEKKRKKELAASVGSRCDDHVQLLLDLVQSTYESVSQSDSRGAMIRRRSTI